MIDELSKLNAKFYEIIYDYHCAASGIHSEKLNNFFEEKIFENYKKEYARLEQQELLERGREDYERECDVALIVPRRRRVWWLFGARRRNLMAKLLEELLGVEAELRYRELSAQIDAESAALKPKEEDVSAADVPSVDAEIPNSE